MNKEMLKKLFVPTMMLLVVFLNTSCVKKHYLYFQDMENYQSYKMVERKEPLIKKGDRLNIFVSCTHQELAIPFNQKGTYSVSEDGKLNPDRTGLTGEISGYMVDLDGYINFPVLGKIYVENMRTSELSSLIKNKIVEDKYLEDPIVTVDLVNFKVTVLGATSKRVLNVDDGCMTIVEALAKVGGMEPRASVKDVKVLRVDKFGKRTVYPVDIRYSDVFQSPVYYLQQDDIIYVKPRYRSVSAKDNSLKLFYTITSISSLITSMIAVSRL